MIAIIEGWSTYTVVLAKLNALETKFLTLKVILYVDPPLKEYGDKRNVFDCCDVETKALGMPFSSTDH